MREGEYVIGVGENARGGGRALFAWRRESVFEGRGHYFKYYESEATSAVLVAVLLAVFEVAEVDHERGAQKQGLLLPGRVGWEVGDEVICI